MATCGPPYARGTGGWCNCTCGCCPPDACPSVSWDVYFDLCLFVNSSSSSSSSSSSLSSSSSSSSANFICCCGCVYDENGTWEIIASGFVGNPGYEDVDGFNTTWTLTYMGNCQWAASAGILSVTLDCVGPNFWVLTFLYDGVAAAIYDSFDPCGNNLSYFIEGPNSTILVPTFGSEGWPDTLESTFSGASSSLFCNTCCNEPMATELPSTGNLFLFEFDVVISGSSGAINGNYVATNAPSPFSATQYHIDSIGSSGANALIFKCISGEWKLEHGANFTTYTATSSSFNPFEFVFTNIPMFYYDAGAPNATVTITI